MEYGDMDGVQGFIDEHGNVVYVDANGQIVDMEDVEGEAYEDMGDSMGDGEGHYQHEYGHEDGEGSPGSGEHMGEVSVTQG